MVAKKILAALFALLILVKLLALLINPAKWLSLAGLLTAHTGLVTAVFAVLLVIIAFLIFASLDLLDIALVMFFTSLLTGLSLMPYSASWMKVAEETSAVGLGKAWLALAIWIALALAVLVRVFAKEKRRRL